MIEDGIALRLVADSGVQACVQQPSARVSGNSPAGDNGVFPAQSPEAAVTPYVVYSVVAGSPVTSMGGVNRLAMIRLQVDCFGSSYGQAKALARAVDNALSSFTGVLTDTDATQVDSLLPIGPGQDFFEEAPLEYRVMLEFQIWFHQ